MYVNGKNKKNHTNMVETKLLSVKGLGSPECSENFSGKAGKSCSELVCNVEPANEARTAHSSWDITGPDNENYQLEGGKIERIPLVQCRRRLDEAWHPIDTMLEPTRLVTADQSVCLRQIHGLEIRDGLVQLEVSLAVALESPHSHWYFENFCTHQIYTNTLRPNRGLDVFVQTRTEKSSWS